MSAVLAPSPATELWYTRCPVPTASGIAQHKRWLHGEFARQGIRLASIRASQDRAVRESHFRHSLTGSFREGGNVPPIWTRARGQDTAVVAITWVDEEQLVLVRPDSDIHNAPDLRGRKLGIVKKEASDLVDVGRAEGLRGLTTALKIHGIARDDVRWVDLPAAEWELREGADASRRDVATEALLAGAVDAIFIKGARSAAALERGLRPVFNINREADPLLRLSAGSPRPVTVDRATLRDHPDLVARYLAVLLKTAEWARTHPDDVVATIAAETGATEAAVRQAFGPRLHEAFEPQLSDVYVQGLRAQKDWLLAEGFIPADFDLGAWIDPAPLASARALAAQVELRAD
ncbi:ABC transporter substrate-binding protein [Xylophilus sp.]|uniref:ABC transporter substrate-binding protein n=1 Tax=Xylophilus sp. TaxID=2653893 RepID=UPI0013B949B0|nr:ABC transporter substrate-binding protein [Xylophilus sp.]KAF1050122.1 MAG: 2'-hydroxybiphenyl-2-sulfinate desulfinase [Xylophilus sp.]